MPGLKKHLADVRFGGNKVTPDEIDHRFQYVVSNPTVSGTWLGTAAGGTAGQSKSLVIVNRLADYPRNILYGLVGTNDVGGTWTVNGKNQFGESITETVALATAAAGTPAAVAYGTKVFAEVSSGTFTYATANVGSGSARIGFGSVGTSNTFGLPVRIAGTTEVKSITWIDNGTVTTLNGGTITGLVGTAQHTFRGTAGVSITDKFIVNVLTTYNSEDDVNVA